MYIKITLRLKIKFKRLFNNYPNNQTIGKASIVVAIHTMARIIIGITINIERNEK